MNKTRGQISCTYSMHCGKKTHVIFRWFFNLGHFEKKWNFFFQTVSFHLKYFSHPVTMTWSSVCNGHDFISCFWQTINFWNDNVSEQKFSDTDHFGNDVKKATLRSWCINLYHFFNVNFIHAYTPLCIISIITKYEH